MKELWKTVTFDFEYTNQTRYEVSNLGRIRSFNVMSDGRILKGSMIEGYRVLKLRLFSPRTAEKEAEFSAFEQKILALKAEKNTLVENNGYPGRIIRLEKQIEDKKRLLSHRKKVNLKKRTNYISILFHRLVAEYFLPEPTPEQTIIAHLDFDKTNNYVDNLKWMTPDENYAHRLKSPGVIKEMRERKYTQKYQKRKKAWKLDATKVMHIKMLLKRNHPIRRIAEKYSVSQTQIRRIQSGENWGHIKI